ncbi:hypothetical protein K438DRAFT_1764699 [Mycena galopus ATCC 62051]|nr:hypothetical protein K438DRAFT_1764699 [Mycena galopus ATCC 62051]
MYCVSATYDAAEHRMMLVGLFVTYLQNSLHGWCQAYADAAAAAVNVQVRGSGDEACADAAAAAVNAVDKKESPAAAAADLAMVEGGVAAGSVRTDSRQSCSLESMVAKFQVEKQEKGQSEK